MNTKMSASLFGPKGDSTIRDTAARWVVKKDRRLSAEEVVELAAWLAADARHEAAFERAGASWGALRELGAVVRRGGEVAPVARARRSWAVMGGLAAAAAVALAFVSVQRSGPPRPASEAGAVSASRAPVTRHLADGSIVRLKEGAEIAEAFSSEERRVKLVRGEAFFTVAKDAARPFFVEVGEVTVRAVGTAFAVRWEPHAVDVLVTEGTVRVTPPVGERASLVEAGHRAVVARSLEPQAPAVVVSAVSAVEIARSLAWNEPMLELGGATLGELVEAFSARTGRRIEIGDAALGAVRIGGRFPLHDTDGFLRALAEIYDVKSERRTDGVIVLRKGR